METSYLNMERKFETNKEKLKDRLLEFLEVNKETSEFSNKQYGGIIKWFWGWLAYNPPVKVKQKTIATWANQ